MGLALAGGGGAGATTIDQLTDTPATKSGSGNFFVKINSGGTLYEYIEFITASGIADSTITNIKLANMAADTLKGRRTSAGAPEDISNATLTPKTPVSGRFCSRV